MLNIISVTTAVSYFIGILFYVTDVQDYCDMTYMFEYPQFVKISDDNFPFQHKYNLYAYSEGRLTANVRKMHFDGNPVIFVPGNGGSYKQVRSLSSVALRKALNSHLSYHFDYFTLDFNEELTGTYSSLLEEQMEYLNRSIHRILNLYQPRKKSPKSVILIGHSMGGVLALKYISSLPQDSTLIPIVITLAAPVSKPVIMLDRHIHKFYNLEGFPKSTLMINIAGGFSDLLVPAYLTTLMQYNTINIASTNIPRCWVETDHRQILWCKQLILVINRALFDCIDQNTLQISSSMEHIKSVFQHHFIYHPGEKIQPGKRNLPSFAIEDTGQWIENLQRQFSILKSKGFRQSHFYMIAITSMPSYKQLTVLAINLPQSNWIFGCTMLYPKGSSKICVEGVHLNHISQIAPSTRFKRKISTIDLQELKINNSKITHVIVKAGTTDNNVALHFDQYGQAERQMKFYLPPWYAFGHRTILEKTEHGAVCYTIELPNLNYILQAYQLIIKSHCSNHSYHVSASLVTSWTHHTQHGFYTEEQERPLMVRLYTSKPTNSEPAKIVMIFEPQCTYMVSIISSPWVSLSLLVRYYSPLLIANITCVVLLVLKAQLVSIRENNKCIIIFKALELGYKPLIILTCLLGISRLISAKQFLLNIDIYNTESSGIDVFLPLLLYICSVGIVWIFAVLLCGTLFVLESTVHKLMLKLLTKSIPFTLTWSDYIFSVIQSIPFLVCLILVFVSISTCGGLALCIGSIFYFLKLTQLSQTVIEEYGWFLLKKIGHRVKYILRRMINYFKRNNRAKEQVLSDKNRPKNSNKNFDTNMEPPSTMCQDTLTNDLYNTIFFHFTLFIIWGIETCLNIPAVITWAHNFKYNKTLINDESFLPGLIFSICAYPLWQMSLPKTNKKYQKHVEVLTSILAITSLLFATVSVYRLNYLLIVQLVLIVMHQSLAPDKEITQAENKINVNYDNCKIKPE